MTPLPVGDLGHVLSVLGDVLLVLKQLVPYRLLGIGGAGPELRQPINDVAEEVKPIEIVHHHHVERRARRAFFLVAAHVQVLVVGPPVREPMDQPGVAVEGEHDRLVLGEERIEVLVRQAMRVLALRLQFHQVDDVDDPDLQRREMLPKQIHRGQRLQRGHVTAASHHHIRLASLVVAGPFPDSDAGRAMFDRLIHRQPLRGRLFARDDDVHIVAAAQAVIGHRQERVRVRREIHADDIGFLVYNVIDEPGVLVAESVVILPPDVGRQEIIERGDRPPPRYLVADLQPLGVLIEHRVDDVDERLITGKKPVPAGQEISFQPALALVLAEHFHHACRPGPNGRRTDSDPPSRRGW